MSNLLSKIFLLSSVSCSSKLIEPEEGTVGISDFVVWRSLSETELLNHEIDTVSG